MADINPDTSLRIRVLNPERQALGGTVDIEFKPQTAGQTLNVKGADASKDIDVSGLQRTPQGLYQVTVTPTDVFKPTSQFVTVPASGFNTVEFVIDKGTAAEPGSGGEDEDICIRVRALNPQRQPLGGTVNIECKPQDAGETVNVKGADASKDIDVSGLQRTPRGLYLVTITPTDVFKPTAQFVTIPACGFITVEFVIDKDTKRPPCTRIPDTFGEKDLPAALSPRLMGTSADGSRTVPPSEGSPVIWVDAGDEVLVHLDSTQIRILDKVVLVSVDLETDQTGRTPLIVSFSLGDANDPGGLIATTDDLPRGNGLLAARWGRVLQNAVWASLLSLAKDHADERSGAPQAISIAAGQLRLQSGTPFQAASSGGQP